MLRYLPRSWVNHCGGVSPPLTDLVLSAASYPGKLTISVMEISQSDSNGAPKNPWSVLLAIHWPLLVVNGAQSMIASW